MRQTVQFARRSPATRPKAPQPARQMKYSRPVSPAGTIGFAFLSLSLAAMTFVFTIWGGELPGTSLQASPVRADALVLISKTPQRVFVDAVQLEPKTTERLPIFGGLTPVE